MLAINQIEFENIPIETPSMLAAIRYSGKLPIDQIPLLEINGLFLRQSSGMVRYLARRGKFYPEDPEEALWCDMIAGAVADFEETRRISDPYQRVMNTNGISSYLNSDQRYPVADDKYITDVARVLKRHLPSHMDRPDRFV